MEEEIGIGGLRQILVLAAIVGTLLRHSPKLRYRAAPASTLGLNLRLHSNVFDGEDEHLLQCLHDAQGGHQNAFIMVVFFSRARASIPLSLSGLENYPTHETRSSRQ